MCVLPVSSPWLFLPRPSVCVRRVLCVLSLFSVFLFVFLFPSLSLSRHHSSRQGTRFISTKEEEEEEEERLKVWTTEVKKKEKKEEEERTTYDAQERGKGVEEKVKRLHSVECRPLDT